MKIFEEYLNELFKNYNDNPNIKKTKKDLLNLMNEKYEELLNEGNSEKEAIITVINEFGDLSDLDLESEKTNLKEEKNNSLPKANKKEVIAYILYRLFASISLSIAILLLIQSPMMLIVFDMISNIKGVNSAISLLGFPFILLYISIAIILIGVSSELTKKVSKNNLTKEDIASSKALVINKKITKVLKIILNIIGVLICVGAFISQIVLGILEEILIPSHIGVIVLLSTLSIGAMFIVFGNNYYKLVFNELYSTESYSTEYYSVDDFNTKYYFTLFCVYLMVSFILNSLWNFTWIILILGLIVKLIINLARKEKENEK